jgi:hypothetical protein
LALDKSFFQILLYSLGIAPIGFTQTTAAERDQRLHRLRGIAKCRAWACGAYQFRSTLLMGSIGISMQKTDRQRLL